MNRIVWAFVWDLNDESKAIIEGMVKGALESSPAIISLSGLSEKDIPVPAKSDICLCFGPRPYNLIKDNIPQAVLLPLLSKLKNVPDNTTHRSSAWNKLLSLKGDPITTPVEEKKSDSEVVLKPEDVAHNLTLKSKELLRHLEEDGSEFWIGTTAAGKKVLISKTTNQKTNLSDFQITFEELYAAKLAIELLALTSLTLTKGKKE